MSCIVVRAGGNPTAREWIDIKPIFLKLYLKEGKTLGEVRQSLKNEHNFVATEKAFKRRITLWNVRKNYTKEQKKALAEQKKSDLQSVHQDLQSIKREQPIKWNRVVRYEADLARQRKRDQKSSSKRNQVDSIIVQEKQPTFIESVSCVQSPFLRALQQLCRLTLAQTGIYAEQRLRLDLRLPEAMATAMLYLSVPSQVEVGWNIIHENCQTLHQNPNYYQYGIWSTMVNFVVRPMWAKHESLRSTLFSYFAGIAYKSLPSEHPLNVIMQHISGPAELKQLAPQALRAEFEIVRTGSCSSRAIREYILLTIIYNMMYCQLFGQARQYALSLLKQEDISVDGQIAFLCLIADTCYQETQYERGIEHGLSALKIFGSIESKDTVMLKTKKTLSEIYRILSDCYRALNDQEQTVSSLMLSFEMGRSAFGRTAFPTVDAYSAVERVLIDFRRVEELRAFHVQHPAIEIEEDYGMVRDEEHLDLGQELSPQQNQLCS